MALPNNLSPELKKLLWGTPWGEVYPSRPNPPPLAYDGRTVALRILRDYLSEITFRRPGGRTAAGASMPPIDFRIAKRDIMIGWPDYEKELQFPSIVFLHGSGNYDMIGLTSYVEEDSRDKYAPGTVVMWMSEYVETVQVEIWANKKAELRSVLAGVETALSPTEQMYGLRFRMADYFDQLVRFSPGKRQENDDADGARDRRSARLEVEMAFHVVSLVNYATLRPELKVVVDADTDYNTAITDDELGPSKPSGGACEPCG
jgi:hypothetical protein